MEIRDLIYLEAAAAAGNFTRAAKTLGIDASTISRRVGRFEDALGVALFERGRAGLRLTGGGKAALPHIRRALAELDEIKHAGDRNGNGLAGEVRLAVRMPPIGEPLRELLSCWRERHHGVLLTLWEMSDRDIEIAMRERRIDIAVMVRHEQWSDSTSLPLYRERLLVAIPHSHFMLRQDTLGWEDLRKETLLVQGWDNSQAAREFYTSLVGTGARFHVHASSKQCILALVAAGFGITVVTESQSEVSFPRIAYRMIREENAWIQVELVWNPEIEDPVVGRFVAFMRDAARSRRLF